MRWLIAFLLAGAAVACSDSDDTPTSPSFPQGPGLGPGPGIPPSGGTLTDEVLNAMERAILDEYHAEAIYSRVLEDFGAVLPFANVVQAEVRHSAAIARQYSNRGLPVPEDPWHRDNVPRFQSVPEACAAAVVAEEENIAMYDELLRLSLPEDVERVFTSNRAASLQAHLPAFRLCAGS